MLKELRTAYEYDLSFHHVKEIKSSLNNVEVNYFDLLQTVVANIFQTW